MRSRLGFIGVAMASLLIAGTAHAAPADPDTGFGSAGVASAAAGRTLALGAPLAQPTGKTIVAGVNAAGKVVLVRFTASGALDAGFGTNGEIVTDLAPTFSRAALADAGGGAFHVVVGSESTGKLTLERFTADGVITAKVSATVAGGLVWPVAAVAKADGSTYVAAKFDCAGTYCFGVAKFKGGGLDPTFTSKGYVTTKIGSYSRPTDLSVLPGTDGVDRITVVGSLSYPGLASADTALARYKGTGVLDTAFDGDGLKTLDLSAASQTDWATGVAQSPNGSITVSGVAQGKGYTARFTSTGAADGAFGTQGVVRGGFAGAASTYRPADVVLDSAGRAVVVGATEEGSNTRWTASRLTAAGAFDTAFAPGGTTQYTACANTAGNGAAGVSLTADRIRISGACGGDGRTAVMRLVSVPTFTGGASLAVSPDAEAAGHQLIRVAALDPQQVLGSVAALQVAPLRSNPLRSNPLRSNPLRSNPLRSNPLRSNPLRSNGIADKLVLSQFPLVDKEWSTLLAGYIDRPLQTVTLADALASGAPGVAGLTAADVDFGLTPLRSVSAAALLLGLRPLAALPAPSGGWCSFLSSKPLNCTSGVDLSVTTLVDLELAQDISAYYENPINLAGVDLGTGDNRAPLAFILLRDTELSLTPFGAVPARDVGALLACGANCTGTLAERQAADPSGFSNATLGDLLARLPLPALPDVSLGALMRGLVASEHIPYQAAPRERLLAQADVRTTRVQTYTVEFTVDCGQASGLKVTPALLDDARPVPGSASAVVAGQTKAVGDPVNGSYELAAACAGQDGYAAVRFSFRAEPGSDLGPGAAKVTISTPAATLSAQVATTVDDSLDPGDEVTTPRDLPVDDIVTGHIASATDIDFYRIPAPAPGSKLTVTLAHLPADYDLSILGPPSSLPTAPLRSNPLRSNPLRSNPVPDQSNAPVAQTTPADTLQDIPLRSNPLRSNPLRSNSINRGAADEAATVIASTADQGKDFLVAVTSFNGASDPRPYDLRARVSAAAPVPACQAQPALSTSGANTLPGTIPNTTRTLILVNEQRMRERDGDADTDRAMASLGRLATASGGAVIAVDVPQTAAAYAALDANPCSVDAANGVVTAINGVVDDLRRTNGGLPQLRSIQLVGPDSVIPQARVRDETVLSNEADYADSATFRGLDNAVSRAQREGYLLTDDVYGDFDPAPDLYVPDVALGRLVESADQIADQADAFVAAGGAVAPARSFVTGYDFLSDGAQQTFDALKGRAAGSLLLDSWSAAQARDGANAPGAAYTSINGHYDNYRALPGLSDGPLLAASDVVPPAGSVLFNVGCHSGLNLAVALSGPDAEESARLGDWPEQIGASSSLYVGNTGFGYGDTAAVAYSEKLMASYAEQLATGAATAGQALMFAKQADAGERTTTDDYANKSLMGATFYGIAMYRIGTAGTEAPSALPRRLDGPVDAVRASTSYTLAPASLLTRHDTADGSYWTAGEDPLVVQNRATQPLVTRDVTPADGAPVHGAILEALATSELTGIDHVIGRPIVDSAAHEPEPDTPAAFFPAQLLSTSPVQTANGPTERLTLAAGQARDDVQRLINSATVRVFRSHSSDYEPNLITRVDGLVANGAYSISVDTLGGDEDGGRVLFRTDAGPAWNSVPLAKVGADRLGAGGPLAGGATRIVEAMVWVYDTHGNVAFSNSKVVGYSFEPVTAAPGDPRIVFAPAPPANGYYTTPPTVSLDTGTHGGAAFEYSVDAGAWKPYTAPFTVSAPTEGEHVIRVRGGDGSQALNRFAVDTQGPTVDASATTAPNVNGWYRGSVTVRFTCADAVSGVASCPADQTLTSDGTGLAVSGTATDRAGHTGSGGLAGINIDRVVPTITAEADRAPNADGWYRDPVTVSFTCADARSGIAACTAPITIAEAQDATAAGTATDKADNQASAALPNLRVDRSDPSAAVTSSGLVLLSKVSGTAGDGDATDPRAISGVKDVRVTYRRTNGSGAPEVRTQGSGLTLTCNADRTSCTWTADPPPLGSWRVEALTTDRSGRTGPVAASTISVN